jgi:tRNA A-37 threonylcarbamoyl transferase component Bud32
VLEEFKWRGFFGVRRSDKQGAIRVFMGLRHCLEDFVEGRSIARFEVNGEQFYVKRFRGPLLLWRPLSSSSLRNAMFNEMSWLQHIDPDDALAPKLWLFMERRIGCQVETYLLMSEVEGQPLALLEGKNFALACASAVETIGKLHARGIAHGDCNLYNFIVGDEVRAIDFERAAELTPALAEADLYKFFARIKARGDVLLLDKLVSHYLQVRPQPLFDIGRLVKKLQGENIPPVDTRWRPPQFFSISIGRQRF